MGPIRIARATHCRGWRNSPGKVTARSRSKTYAPGIYPAPPRYATLHQL